MVPNFQFTTTWSQKILKKGWYPIMWKNIFLEKFLDCGGYPLYFRDFLSTVGGGLFSDFLSTVGGGGVSEKKFWFQLRSS